MATRWSLLLLASPALVAPWCCRACGTCFCEHYGLCHQNIPPAADGLELKPMTQWSNSEVAQFIDSLSVNGSRQACTAGCSLPKLFVSNLWVARGVDGPALLDLVASHEKHETTLRDEKGWFPNATALRAAHSHELLRGLLPDGMSKRDAAYMNRLRASARAATKSRPPTSPPPAGQTAVGSSAGAAEGEAAAEHGVDTAERKAARAQAGELRRRLS